MARGEHSRRTFLSWHPLQHGPGGQFSGPQADSCEPRRPGEPSEEGAGFSSEPRGTSRRPRSDFRRPANAGRLPDQDNWTERLKLRMGPEGGREGGRQSGNRGLWDASFRGRPLSVSAMRKPAAVYLTSKEDKAGFHQAPPGSSLLGSLSPPPPHPTIWGRLYQASLPLSAFVVQRHAS